MTSKERFDLTVNHKQPDKLVVDMGSTGVTGIHVLTVENLRRHYGLENRPVRVIVPVPAGGTPDVVARMVAPGLSAIFGQQLVIGVAPGCDRQGCTQGRLHAGHGDAIGNGVMDIDR